MNQIFSLRFPAILCLLLLRISFSYGQWEFIGSPNTCRPIELDQEGDTIVLLTGAGLYFSVDSTASWSPIEGPPGISLIRTIAIEDGSLYVNVNTPVTYNAQKTVLTEVYRSDDWGMNWSLITEPLDSARSFRTLMLRGDRVWYAGQDSIYTSFDKGAHFSIVHATPARYANYFQHKDVLFAQYNLNGGLGQVLLSSVDFGANWDTIYQVDLNVYIKQLRTIDDVLWILIHDYPAGNLARIGKSYDDGQTWTFVSPVQLTPGDVRLDDILGDTNNLYVASSFSSLNLFRSVDGGATWSAAVDIPSRVPLYTHGQLLFPSQEELVISADHGVSLTRVENGIFAATVTHLATFESDLIASGNNRAFSQPEGESDWNEIPGFIQIEHMRSGPLLAMNEDHAFRSTDGVTWDTITSTELGQPEPARIFNISCLDNMMYVVDYRFDMYYSADFGATWYPSGKRLVYAFAYNGKYMLQHDVDIVAVSSNGIDWEDLPETNYPGPYYIADDLEWLDPYYFFCADTLLLRLHKDSTKWEHIHVPFTNLTRSPAPTIHTYSMVGYNQHLFIAWYGQGVVASDDYGATWYRINEGLSNLRSCALSIVNGDLVLGVEGGVWRRALSSIITQTQKPGKELLFRASPNPARDEIRIRLSTPSFPGEVTFILYDAQGVAVRSTTFSGDYDKVLSVSDLIPGIYFLYGQAGEYEGWVKIMKQ